MEVAKIRAALPPECDRLLSCALECAPFTIGRAELPPNLIAIAIAAAVDSRNARGYRMWKASASAEEWAEALAAVVDAEAGRPSIAWYLHPLGAPHDKAKCRFGWLVASQVAFERVINGIGGPLDAYAFAIRQAGIASRFKCAQRELAALDRIFAGLELAPMAQGGAA